MHLRSRRGVFIGLVLIILVVLAILGYIVMNAGVDEYGQTVMVAAGLKAQLGCETVLEEALAVVYDKCTRPYDEDIGDDVSNGREEPPWKKELLPLIMTMAGGRAQPLTATGSVKTYDLVALGLLPDSTVVVDMGGGDGNIDECTVDFNGFRRILSPPSMPWESRPDLDYKDPDHLLDEAGVNYPFPNDYQGYVTIRVTTSWGVRPRVRRQLAATYDIKIVNQTPLANQFACFQMARPPDEAYARGDLTNTMAGGIKVFPCDVGRCYVCGPFWTDSQGFPNGTGGRHAPTNSSSYVNGDEWHGWSLVPSPRASIVKGNLFNAGIPPMRPKKTSDDRYIVGIANLLFCLLNGTGDPGFSLKSPAVYFCESKKIDEVEDRNFSLVGAPEEGAASVSRFKGIQEKFNDDGTPSNKSKFDGGSTWPNVGNTEDRWAVVTEGNLFQNIKLVQATYDTYAFGLYEKYKVKPASDGALPYGVHWMKCIEASFGDVFGGWLMNVGMAVLTVVSCGAMAGVWAAGSAAMATALNVGLAGAAAALIGGAISVFGAGSGYPTGSFNLNMDQFVNTMPSNYREIARTTTRAYETMEEIRSYCLNAPDEYPLVLDGNIWIREPFGMRPFGYLGRGSILLGTGQLSTVNGGACTTIEGPIVAATRPTTDPATNEVTSQNDHLNLWHIAVADNMQLGNDMLVINPAPEITAAEVYPGGPARKQVPIEASVFAPQGVSPSQTEQNVAVMIRGNLITCLFNKYRIPPSSQVRVYYNPAFSPGRADETARQTQRDQFANGPWHQMSMSFRPSGWYDRIRR